jgi:hypothetical protein
MKKYTIGLITGALLAISGMMFIGAQNKNLGDITVNSITIKSDNNGGWIRTYNTDGKETVKIGSTGIGNGIIETYNSDGKQTVFLGTGVEGIGFLETYNEHAVRTGYFGTNTDNDGVVVLFDRYGDEGWGEDGKQ